MDWIMENWDMILEGIGGLIVFASFIVKITPTETDNEALAKFIRFWEFIAMNNKPVEKKTK